MPENHTAICIRTKGNHAQGMGDVMGSLAIAEEFRARDQKVLFVVDDDPETVTAIQEKGYQVVPVADQEEDKAWHGYRFEVVIVNQLSTPYDRLATIKKHCKTLITIDDTGEASRQLADIRINPLYYDAAALCDTAYIPLHPVFQKAHQTTKDIHDRINHVLVTMGGSDTYGLTPQIIDVLSDYPAEVAITVIIGPAFQHETYLEKALHKAARSFNMCRAVSEDVMCAWIQWADVAICAAGNTLFEMACCGTPAVIICGEPFEEETAFRIENMGFGRVLSFNKKINAEYLRECLKGFESTTQRTRHSQRGRQLIDGLGIRRIADVILKAMNKPYERTGCYYEKTCTE